MIENVSTTRNQSILGCYILVTQTLFRGRNLSRKLSFRSQNYKSGNLSRQKPTFRHAGAGSGHPVVCEAMITVPNLFVALSIEPIHHSLFKLNQIAQDISIQCLDTWKILSICTERFRKINQALETRFSPKTFSVTIIYFLIGENT